MQATDGVLGSLWINYIFDEFERLRNKIFRKICKCQIFVVSLCRNSKNNQIMEQQITFDKRNYRKHSEKNKAIIRKSLQELGAGRSVLIDKDGALIAGNGVYEQAQKLNIPVRVVESDGSELVVVKRTDLATGDEKRKKLALADNAAGMLSEWDKGLVQEDWTLGALRDWGVEFAKPIGLDKDGNYSGEQAVTEYEAQQILSVADEYIVVTCKAEEFDAMRAHFGLGYVRTVEVGNNKSARTRKARVVKWSDYANSHTK